MQRFLEALNISHTELGHVLLEVSFPIINFVLELNYLWIHDQLIGNTSVKCDADVHRELKIINTNGLIIKPRVDEVVQDVNIKEG